MTVCFTVFVGSLLSIFALTMIGRFSLIGLAVPWMHLVIFRLVRISRFLLVVALRLTLSFVGLGFDHGHRFQS